MRLGWTQQRVSFSTKPSEPHPGEIWTMVSIGFCRRRKAASTNMTTILLVSGSIAAIKPDTGLKLECVERRVMVKR